ncbi:hypothetical protein [Lysinibacillus xylanilyticus]|uniref:hypothetical protein n=1 Tax=Lysinibacillus xylanilyticus TaxID=582475 RepID=UPI003CFFDE91
MVLPFFVASMLSGKTGALPVASDKPLRFAAGSRANTKLVTKALSQDVMVLAFVPLFADPQGASQFPPIYLFTRQTFYQKFHPTFEFHLNTFTFYRPTSEFYRLTFTFYHPTSKFYRHPPAKAYIF